MSEIPDDLKGTVATLEQLASAVGRSTVGTSAIVRRQQKPFIMVPMSWYERIAISSRASTYRVALHLLYRHWKNRGQPFSLPNRGLKKEGVSRFAKWRALGELEKLGLIAINYKRCPRRSPRITVHM